MIDARSAVEEMAGAMRAHVRRKPEQYPPGIIPVLERYERSVRVKALMAEHHAAMLSSASSGRMGQLEDTLSDSRDPVVLISNDDWEFTVKSAFAGTLTRYFAFSIAVAACINALDTLGRYVHRAYRMETETDLPLKAANLGRIQEVVSASCPLHVALSEAPGLGWMVKLRNLRGECEHGMLAGSYYYDPERSDEPLVLPTYCEDSRAVTIAEYLSWAMTNTAGLIAKVARVIASDPKNAVQLKS